MERELAVLDAAAAATTGRAIAEHVSNWTGWQLAGAVALFSTLAGEVDTGPLIRLAQRDGKLLFFPRMLPGDSLEFVRVDDPASLRPGHYGVREPDPALTSQELPSDTILFIPGIAFDRVGGRLGRGAGYYDRALATIGGNSGPFVRIGVGFEIQIVDSVPMSSTDVRMDRVVTEKGFCQPD